MENIAPLAKVLAEANGLDWQQIKGSGAGGQITEDDVLSHMALIMSGEVEPPSTPVDPEPSAAELAMAASPELLSRAGVDSDLTDLLKMQEDARASMKAEAAAPAATATPDDFELDDEPATTHEEAPLAPAAPAGAGAGAVMGGLLSSLYNKSADSAATDSAAAAHTESAQPAYSAPAASAPADSASTVPAFSMPGISAPAATYAEAQSEPAHTEPAYAATSYAEPAYSEPMHTEPVHAEPAYVASQPAYEPEPQVPPVSAWSQPAETAQPQHQEQYQEQPAYQAAPAASAGNADWKGVYLRRDADVSAAEEARTQLGEVLGDFPLSLLVARAAQKSAASLGLSSVAVANTSGQALNASLTGDLRGSLSGLSDTSNAQADLLVVNAGELDLDDLHFPHATTLSVGRVENGKAALSLNGQVDAAQGARFLSDVAALLSTPVKLLV